MAFGKPGRPREDQEQRRCDIYRRVAPLILDRGMQLTMREAAAASLLSVGGLYHYFPSKRELLLYGLNPQAQVTACRPFGRQNAGLRRASPQRYLDAFLDHQIEMALFVRPSVRVATDIGLPTLSAAIESTVNHAAAEFGALVAEFVPAAGGEELRSLARSLRRSVIAGLFDPSLTREELKATLRALIDGGHFRLSSQSAPPTSQDPMSLTGAPEH